MKDREEWERFWITGSIEDYLKYTSVSKEQESDTYAGFADSNRNYIKGGTDRRI